MKEMNARGSFTASGVGLPPPRDPSDWRLHRLRPSVAPAAPRAASGRSCGRQLAGGLDNLLRRHGDGLGHPLLRLHRLAHRLTAARAPNRLARAEYPPDAWDRGAAEQATPLEQPGVLAVELLERVVGQHGPVDLLGNAQQEGVPASDGTGRWMDVLPAQGSLFETRKFGGIDPVGEGGVDDDGDLRVRMVAPELGDGLFQLSQTRQGSAFGGDVGSVDDDVLNGHVLVVKHHQPPSARHLVPAV